MKIGMLSYHCSPFSLLGGESAGGMNVYLQELNHALTDAYPAKVDVFTRCHDPKYRGITHINKDVRVIHLKAGPERKMSRRSLFGMLTEFTIQLQEFMQGKSYDVIYSHYWLAGMIGESVRKGLGIPHVFNYHTLEFLKKRALNNHEIFCRILAEKSLACDVDMIISSSQEEKDHLIAEYGLPHKKIAVIYPGVNQKIFFPDRKEYADLEMNRNDTEMVFLYIGRIEPVKGLDNLITAWDLIKKNHPRIYANARLVIIGGGMEDQDFRRNPEMNKLHSIINMKNLQDRITFLGSRAQNKLRYYLTASDALVMPSLYESFGLVVVEALACGTPVIVSRIGKIKSIVKDGKNGFSFLSNNPAALAEAIASFPEKKRQLDSGSRIRSDVINTFSWKKTAAGTYAVLHRLAADKKSFTTRSLPGENLRPV